MAGRDVPAGHVLATGVGLDPATAWLAALIDAGFLAEVGWDRAGRVLSVPSQHPLLGWTACVTPGCVGQVYDHDQQVCGACRAGAQPRVGGASVTGPGPAAAVRGGQSCAVAACDRPRGTRRYCRAHYERLLDHRRANPGFDEAAWARREPSVEEPGQVSLHEIPALLVVQVLYGLQQRTRDGARTRVTVLRQLGWQLRAEQPREPGRGRGGLEA
jgi:hypothetical protein